MLATYDIPKELVVAAYSQFGPKTTLADTHHFGPEHMYFSPDPETLKPTKFYCIKETFNTPIYV